MASRISKTISEITSPHSKKNTDEIDSDIEETVLPETDSLTPATIPDENAEKLDKRAKNAEKQFLKR